MKSNKELEETAIRIVTEYTNNKKLNKSFLDSMNEDISLYAFVTEVTSKTLVIPGSSAASVIDYHSFLKNVAREFSSSKTPLTSILKLVFRNDIVLVSMVNSSLDYYFNIFEIKENEINTKSKIKKTWGTVREAKKNKEFDKNLLDIFYAYRTANLELRN